MTTREEHLNWCKARALEILDSGDVQGAFASMTSDLGKWDGGPLYDPTTFAFLWMDAAKFRKTATEMRNWIEGCD